MEPRIDGQKGPQDELRAGGLVERRADQAQHQRGGKGLHLVGADAAFGPDLEFPGRGLHHDHAIAATDSISSIARSCPARRRMSFQNSLRLL